MEFNKNFILLCGHNGVGKSNILESLSLLGRSPSLRNSSFDEMLPANGAVAQFSIFAAIQNHDFIEKIAVSFDAASKKKTFYANDEALSSKRQGEVKNHLINFISLTPQIEQVFISGKYSRREYLDKIVADLDFEHTSRLNDYQKLLRERLLILQKYSAGGNLSKNSWLDIVENKIVELGTAIASARLESIDFFNRAIISFASNFPKPELVVKGDIEDLLKQKKSAVEIEGFYKEHLAKERRNDLENFKTDFGVHRSDFDAIFTAKNISATLSSTGEQKSIMLGITLARAKISALYKKQPTVLLLDEIMAHLDDGKKRDLIEEIGATGLQCFCSATSADLLPSEVKMNLLEIVQIT